MNLVLRTLLLFCTTVCGSICLHAEDNEAIDSSVFHSSLFLRVAPLSVFDLYGAIVPIGVEYNFMKRWSVIGEVGIPLFTYVIQTEKNAKTKISSDIKLRTEIRYYIAFYHTAHTKEAMFIGLDYFYRRQVFFQSGDNAYYKTIWAETTRYYYTEGTAISKNIRGTGLFMGGTSYCGNRIVLEVYLGLGAQRQSANHSNMQVTKKQTYTSGGFETLDQNHLDGISIKPYIPFGFKIAYSLHKK